MAKPLNSSQIREFDDFLKSGNSPLDIFADFFDCLALLIGDDYSFEAKLKTTMQDIIFDSGEDAKYFLRRYTDHYNSIAALVEFLASSEDGEALQAAIGEVLDSLFAAHSGSAEELKDEIVHQSLFILHIIFESYSIDYKTLLPGRLMEEIEEAFGEHLGGAIASLSNAAVRIGRQKSSSIRELKRMAEALLYIVAQLNSMRKQRHPGRTPGDHTGVCAPCPCGSGKKFKDCCMPGRSIH